MTHDGKLQVRMATVHVVRVQLEAGRDGVNTTKVSVGEGFPLEKLMELKRMSRKMTKREEEEELRPLFSMFMPRGVAAEKR